MLSHRSIARFNKIIGVRAFSSSRDDSIRNKEIEFYTNLDDWWGPNCPQAQLHKFNKVRVNFIRRMMLQQSGAGHEIFKDMKVLDVGCGAGILAEGLTRLGMGSVTGIDPTPKCIELAEAHLGIDEDGLAERLQYKNVTIESIIEETDITDSEQLYDLVCCSEVIEHVNDQRSFIHKCIKMVKPEGHFFLSTIAKTPEGYFTNIIMGEHVLGLLPKGTHEWELLISHDTVEKYLSEVDCKTIEKQGATILNPITREMGEIPYLRANYLMMS